MSDIKEIDISNQLINTSDKHNFDQENIFKFDKLNFKEVVFIIVENLTLKKSY